MKLTAWQVEKIKSQILAGETIQYLNSLYDTDVTPLVGKELELLDIERQIYSLTCHIADEQTLLESLQAKAEPLRRKVHGRRSLD